MPGERSRRATRTVVQVRGLARHIGLRAALGRQLRSVPARVADKVYARSTDRLLVKDLDGVGAYAPPQAAAVRVERIRQHHAEELVELRLRPESWNPVQAAKIREYLRKGYQGFLIRRDGRTAGHFWWIDTTIAPTHPDLAEFHVPLGEGDVYGFDYYIAPDERGAGLATDALRMMLAELARLGYRRLWGTAGLANPAALWTYVADGFTTAHTVTTVRLLGRRSSTVVDGAGGQT